MSEIAAHWNYYLVIILMMLGFYAVIARGNMVKKMVGLNIFQTSVFMLYISVGKIDGGFRTHSHWRPSERLFQSPTTCSYPHRDCGRRGHNSCRLCADYSDLRSLWHD